MRTSRTNEEEVYDVCVSRLPVIPKEVTSMLLPDSRLPGLTKVGQAVSAQLHGAADPDLDLQAETAHWFYGNVAQFINMAGK